MSRRISALVLTTLFVIAPLAGCFGDEEATEIVPEDSFQIDFVDPENAVLRSGDSTTSSGRKMKAISPSRML